MLPAIDRDLNTVEMLILIIVCLVLTGNEMRNLVGIGCMNRPLKLEVCSSTDHIRQPTFRWKCSEKLPRYVYLIPILQIDIILSDLENVKVVTESDHHSRTIWASVENSSTWTPEQAGRMVCCSIAARSK